MLRSKVLLQPVKEQVTFFYLFYSVKSSSTLAETDSVGC
jgi:hypothetical protein